MAESPLTIEVRTAPDAADVARLEPLWTALQEHHAAIAPELAPGTPKRENDDAWRMRRHKYEGWIRNPDTFVVVAERDARLIGYALVTVGLGYASWATGDRLATLETLSVVPDLRGGGVGAALIAAVWERLGEIGVEDLAVTTHEANEGARRFYESNEFESVLVTYHAKRTG